MTVPFSISHQQGRGSTANLGLAPWNPAPILTGEKAVEGVGASRRDGPQARERRGSGVLIRGLLFSRGMLELVRKGWRGKGAAEGLWGRSGFPAALQGCGLCPVS